MPRGKKIVKSAKTKAPAPKENGRHRCGRCYKSFQSRKGLVMHSRQHLQAISEIKMLERGEHPEFSKLGAEFKGKNKIIVS